MDKVFREVRSDPVRIKGLVRLCVTILHDVDNVRPVCGCECVLAFATV